MRAADLDDVGPLRRAGLDQRRERIEFGEQPCIEKLDRGDVHRGREGVVGGLAHIDVVIGGDRRLAPQFATEQLDRAVGQHLVDVHVGLRARPGLPDEQRIMIVERARDRLVGGADDRVGLPLRQVAARGIDQRAGLLDDAVGAAQLDRHAVAPDREMMERALRLRAPIAIGGNVDLAHAVMLAAHAGGGDSNRHVAHRRVVLVGRHGQHPRFGRAIAEAITAFCANRPIGCTDPMRYLRLAAREYASFARAALLAFKA